jgi:hypothetical protein
MSPPYSGLKSKRVKKPAGRKLFFNGPHGALSQKIKLFITTGVTTSNPT